MSRYNLEINTLIAACIKKDKTAEKHLFVRYAPYIYGVCQRYSKDDAEAEDYMQEGFVKIFSNLSSFDPTKGNFQGWIARITINTIISIKRKNKIVYIFDDHSEQVANPPDQSDDLSQADITSEYLLKSIRKLPEKYSTILNLHVFENLTHNEIAQILGIKNSSVRSRFTRAKKLLKNILSETKSIAS